MRLLKEKLKLEREEEEEEEEEEKWPQIRKKGLFGLKLLQMTRMIMS